jgi:protein-S-isoprenylcysteine O-methyltransferase Ste14
MEVKQVGANPTVLRDAAPRPEPIDRRRLIIGIGVTLVVYLLCLFVPAGNLAWLRGWLFFVVFFAAGIGISFYLARVNPDVVAGRVNRHKGTKPWDRLIVGSLIPTIVATVIVAALDDGRFHWSSMPWWVCGIGYALLIVGLVGVTWAESVNKFFEPTVRIQTDRGHHVVDTGPYALVRHPGYATAFLLILGIPLALGSYWALIPAATSCLILIVRTVLEDRTLRAELPGYDEYSRRVRFRLVPGLW